MLRTGYTVPVLTVSTMHFWLSLHHCVLMQLLYPCTFQSVTVRTSIKFFDDINFHIN